MASEDDNSELKRRLADAEERLRQGEARRQLLTGSLTQAVWETDAAGNVVADSPSWRAYTGQTLEEWLGDGWLDAIHPDDRAYAERQWREALTATRVVDAEFRLRAPDGGWRWTNVRAAPLLDERGEVAQWVGVNIDIDARKRAEEALRESETRFRAVFDNMIEACCIFDVLYDDLGKPVDWRILEANAGYERQSGLKDVAGKLASEFMPGTETYWTETFGRVAETGTAQEIEEWHQPTDRWVHSSTARIGGSESRRLVSVFYDITERKRAEIALRESEARFQQFAEASAAGLWIRDAATLAMEYASPALGRIYGVAPNAFLGDMKRWAAAIIPEDRETAFAHIEKARRGEAVVHEFRIQRPDDRTFRWIRNTDFPLLDAEGRVQRIGGLAEDVTDAKLATEHQGVLLAELQHRVRNIMAIVRSIAARSGERAGNVQDYAEVLAGRLLALSRVQALLTRAANVSVSLRSIVLDEVSVQAQHEGQYEVDGPEIDISPKAAEVLTLAIHELSTNALKYGALSVPHGRVTVGWTVADKNGTPWLSLDWREEAALERSAPQADKPRRKGFGSELIEGRIPYELKGKATLALAPGGAHCHLEFPLRPGTSVLETGAPQRATVFGGALDMTGEPDLGGRCVLVVEDDYFLAADAVRALTGAGAQVLGPCSTEAETRAKLQEQRPDAVLLDINLGSGPTFKLAEILKDLDIPFVFVTGYDQDIIPPEFAATGRLEKPIQLRRMVGAVSELLTPAA